MEDDLFGVADLEHYQNPCPVLALDEYRKDKGEDEFSREQVWFYVYGHDEIEEEFRSQLKSLLEARFVDDDLDWDLMTVYPTHVKGEVNRHMKELVEKLSGDTGIKYRQVIERTRTIEENHELESNKAKSVNLENSAEVKDFEGENVILVDNISLTGTSMLHGANLLLKNGAKNVFGVCLGIGSDFPGKKTVSRDKKASELIT